jgi:hypothetical protein
MICFLGNIDILNNHHQILLIKWNLWIPRLTILVVKIGVNNDFLSLRQNPTKLSLLSQTKDWKKKWSFVSKFNFKECKGLKRYNLKN